MHFWTSRICVAGESSVDGHAEKALLDAEIFFAFGAVSAPAAADPREYRFPGADQAFRHIGTDFLDDACDLVSERERECHAARGGKLLAAAEIRITILDVQIGMAQQRSIRTRTSLPIGFGVSTTVSLRGASNLTSD
jgi:hypothetical protein